MIYLGSTPQKYIFFRKHLIYFHSAYAYYLFDLYVFIISMKNSNYSS